MATESQATETPRKKTSLGTVLIPLAFILAIVLVALGYMKRSDPAAVNLAHAPGEKRTVGAEISDFEAQALDGSKVKFDDIKSKVVLINFWATWCPPCVKELPSLQKLSDEYSKKGLTVIGINLDEEPPATVEAFLKKHSLRLRSLVDPEGKVADQFGVSGLPLTLVVDRDRKLLLEQTGDEDWFSPTIRKQFETWLAE